MVVVFVWLFIKVQFIINGVVSGNGLTPVQCEPKTMVYSVAIQKHWTTMNGVKTRYY